MDAQTAIDIAIGVCTLIGIVGSGIGAFWLAFRKKLKRWWKPYRSGIDGMSELPVMREAVEQSRKDMHMLRQEVGLISLMVRAKDDTNITEGRFEANPDGSWSYINLTIARWLGVGRPEITGGSGWGWVNFIHPDDRTRVRQEWDLCRSEHRKFNCRFRMLSVDNEVFKVDLTAAPIPDEAPASRWMGVIKRVVG